MVYQVTTVQETIKQEIVELEQFQAMLNDLNSSSSRNLKEMYLTQYLLNSPFVLKYLKAAFDPFKQYNLTNDTAMKFKDENPIPAPHHLLTLLEAFSIRTITGNNAKIIWCRYLLSLPEHLRPVASMILDKDIKARIGLKTVNKVLKGLKLPLIKEFQVALGDKWEGQEVWKEEDWHVSRKLDGVRCLAVIGSSFGSGSVLYSRKGKVFETLNVLKKELDAYTGAPFVLDGELALQTEDSSDDFQGLMSQIRRKDHQIENPVYHVFDAISLEEFEKGIGNTKFSERLYNLRNLNKTIWSPKIKVVEQHLVPEEGIEKYLEQVQQNNWEGLMLRKDTGYKGKRSKDLLKVKKMHDFEAIVKDASFTKMRILKEGIEHEVDALHSVTIDYKENIVSVGSGFTMEQRQAFYADPSLIIGKTITVQYFEETTNKEGKHSLRFPVVKHIHGNERLV